METVTGSIKTNTVTRWLQDAFSWLRPKQEPKADPKPTARAKDPGVGRGRCATVALQNGDSTSMAMELCDYRELQSIKVEE